MIYFNHFYEKNKLHEPVTCGKNGICLNSEVGAAVVVKAGDHVTQSVQLELLKDHSRRDVVETNVTACCEIRKLL